MKTFLFDTNFLLLPGLQGIDVFGELNRLVSESHQLATLSSVVGELEGMRKTASNRGVAANVALELIKQKKVRVHETHLKADDSLLDYALKHENTVVCTNDRELKRKLKKHGIRVISPKGRSYLTYV
jgi:rRNA-processing protein FCF1